MSMKSKSFWWTQIRLPKHHSCRKTVTRHNNKKDQINKYVEKLLFFERPLLKVKKKVDLFFSQFTHKIGNSFYNLRTNVRHFLPQVLVFYMVMSWSQWHIHSLTSLLSKGLNFSVAPKKIHHWVRSEVQVPLLKKSLIFADETLNFSFSNRTRSKSESRYFS